MSTTKQRVDQRHQSQQGGTTATSPPASDPQSLAVVLGLLEQSRMCLAEAAAASRASDRYALAHLGALRAAAAVLASRATPGRRPSRRLRTAWELLADLAPELSEWAAFFAQGAGRRAAAEAGIPGAVTTRQADDLLREADAFLMLVCRSLGLPAQQTFDSARTVALS